ncbi:MAG: hypothetical protein ACOYU7_01575 [Bacillota bacterium]
METNLGPGLSNLEWTPRMEPCFADTLTSAWWWWPQADIVQVAFKHQELADKHPLVGPCLTLDLRDVDVAIALDPKAHAFFLDLACWLLTKCAAAIREGGET